LTKLLTKLGASLEYYEPDAIVKSYLYQHAHSLGWDKDKLNFRNPKEKDSRHKGDSRSTKRTSPNSKIEGRDNKTKHLKANPQNVSPRDQYKRKSCRDKGTHITHTHKDCRYKSNDRPQKSGSDVKRHDGPRHPNLGQTPPKKLATQILPCPARALRLRPRHVHVTSATNRDTLPQTVQIRPPTSKRPKTNCSKTRTLWSCGKNLGTTRMSKHAHHES
jgi:hypothetical protein